MSKEIEEKLIEKKNLSNKYSEILEKIELERLQEPKFERDPRRIDCRKCGAKAGKPCRTFFFRSVSGYCYERISDLTDTEEYKIHNRLFDEHDKLRNKLRDERDEKYNELSKLGREIKSLEHEENYQKSMKEFKQGLDTHTLKNSSVVISMCKHSDEWCLKVIESKNIMFLMPGDEIPDGDCIGLLMEKGIDVTVKRGNYIPSEDSAFRKSFSAGYGPGYPGLGLGGV